MTALLHGEDGPVDLQPFAINRPSLTDGDKNQQQQQHQSSKNDDVLDEGRSVTTTSSSEERELVNRK